MQLQAKLSLQKGAFELETELFKLPAQGVTAIFGHSGSGKTTLMRCLAGFEQHAQGEVRFGDHDWLSQGQTLPIHKRCLGYVFQEPSLFSHLTVEGNLRYGLKRASKPYAISFEQVVDWLGLAALLSRDVHNLSGGERQRVAIGRTLLSQPRILMMDEPLAALDVFAKRAILPYLEKLRDALEIPILYITHSPEEVERLADTVVFMAKGRITQIEPIEEALNRVGTPLYQQTEPRAVLSATVANHYEAEGLSELRVGGEALYVPAVNEAEGTQLRIVIAAQQVSLMAVQPEKTSMLNHLEVEIESLESHNDYSQLVRLRLKGEPWPLLAQVTKRSVNRLSLQVGQTWIAAIKSVSILN